MFPARDEPPTIIKTSAGVTTHAVKKGTFLSTNLMVAQMDPFFGQNLKPSRQIVISTTKENPLPTAVFSVLVGTIDDEDKFYNNSHFCVMARLNIRVVEAFIKMLTKLPRLYDLLVDPTEGNAIKKLLVQKLLKPDTVGYKFDDTDKNCMRGRKIAEKIAFHM